MKKSLVAVSVLTAFAGSTHAQSSVTIYGVVDLAGHYVSNNSGHIWSEVNGALNANRLGFKGTEDLGGGLNANFNLEADIFADTGQVGGNTTTPVPAGQLFSRISTVGLKSNTLGEVRFGRDYTLSFLSVVGYDPFGYVGVGSISNLFSSTQVATVFGAFGPNTTSANDLARVNNSAAYYTPNTLGGFFAAVQGALAEGPAPAGSTGNTKFWNARAGYSSGPLQFDVSHAETKNTNVAGQTLKETVVGGYYDFRVVKLTGEYTQLKYVAAKSTVGLISANVPINSGVSSIKISYARLNQSGNTPVTLGATRVGSSIDDRDASQLAAGYTYNLSKRTAIYTQAARIMNKGVNAGLTIPGGPALIAGSDRTSTAYELGLRHIF